MAETGLPEVGGGRRLYLLIAVAAAVIFMLFFLLFRSCGGGGKSYVTIYSDLELKDAGLIAKKLEEEKVPYRVGEEGHSIAVPKDQTAKARMSLATEGLPSGGIVGFEIFDETQMGASSFDRKVKFVRAISGELSRAIASLEPVDRAKVQIVIPEEKLFSAERSPATASVLIRMKPGQSLSPEQVSGIVYLVSSSVEGLKPEYVAVIDDSGHILVGTSERLTTPMLGQAEQEALTPEEKIVVQGEATPEASPLAEKPAEQKEEKPPAIQKAEEKPSVDLTARSNAKKALEQELVAKAVSVLANFYPAHAVEVRVNVDVKELPLTDVRRMTALVLVNEKFPMTPTLKKDTFAVVAAAIGYDPRRKDFIEIRRVPFLEGVVQVASPPPAQKTRERFSLFRFLFGWIANIPRVLFLVLLAGLLLAVLVRRRRAQGRKLPYPPGESTILRPRPPGREPTPLHPEGTPKGPLEEIRALAEKDPEKIASVLKHWLSEENG